MTPTIRVLVVDDHSMARDSVTGLLNDTDGIAVVGEAVGEAADGQEAVDLAAALRPDVVLMDVTMPEMSGLEAAAVPAQRGCRARVLMLSAESRGDVVQAARTTGAAGFLSKRSRHSDVVSAIRTVHSGGSTWPGRA